jgi:hypothetical protein
MKPQEAPGLTWAGVDLHVHTPASADYRGTREDDEFINIVKRANEFGPSAEAGEKKGERKGRGQRNPIGCVAFTDHNSVEGFRRYRSLHEEIDKLSKAVRARDPSNPLVDQLEKDLEAMRSVRVLMGVEVKADPGIHMLVIFAESVEADHVVPFLEEAYQAPYRSIAGDPTPTARWTLKDTLDRIHERFSDNAFVVFPHVDSSGGVYEDLKEFAQARIGAMTHPAVRALSFNREETREKLRNLFGQPDYKRGSPVALIQSSDFHGAEGAVIGQPKTELLVKDGRPTFRNIREAFREHGRIKCSVDFVAEEYRSLTRGRDLCKYVSDAGGLGFNPGDSEEIAAAVCAMLNSRGGVLELEGPAPPLPSDEPHRTSVRNQLDSILSARLDPPFSGWLQRSLRPSAGKVRVLHRIFRSDRLRSANGKVFIMDEGKVRVATPAEIEVIVSENLNQRFGYRFEGTLERSSKQSTLLAKLPPGIPLLLRCQKRLAFGIPEFVKILEIEPAGEKDPEAGEAVHDLIEDLTKDLLFGDPKGNATVLHSGSPPRYRDHYLRFTAYRAHVAPEIVERCAWGKLESPAIAAHFGGGFGLVEPGHVISEIPALLLQFDGKNQADVYALLSWLKSSFFLWYCAVHMGETNAYMQLHLRLRLSRLPMPGQNEEGLRSRLSEHAHKLVGEEVSFMEDIIRLKKKGTLDSDYQEKSRRSHNRRAAQICLSIDKDVYDFLALPLKDQKLIAETLRDMEMTDFGFLEELGEHSHE